MPVSFFIAHFDEVCEARVAELDWAKIVPKSLYQLFYDPSGHDLFKVTNSFVDKMMEEMKIGDGEAEALRLQAKEYLRRTGGYINPADESIYGDDNGAESLLYQSLATLLLVTASSALL